MKKTKRTALLIRCSEEEAVAIRAAARKEGRTISAHVLRIVMQRQRVALRDRLEREHDNFLRAA